MVSGSVAGAKQRKMQKLFFENYFTSKETESKTKITFQNHYLS
jgi:hypothetical protein